MEPTHDSTPGREPWTRRASDWLRQDVWQVDLGGVPTFRRWWTKAVRVVLISLRGFVRDQCTRHAMALTYITIFALPPFLAFVFSIAKGFGVYRKLKEGTIDTFLDANFGADEDGQVRQAIDQIFAYVEDTPLGSVAAIGLIVILYAVFKLLGAVEYTLNDIWGIRRPRTLVRKITDYLAIVTVTPILLLSGAGMTAYFNDRVARLVHEQDDPPAAQAPREGAVEQGSGGAATGRGGAVAREAAEPGEDAAAKLGSGAAGDRAGDGRLDGDARGVDSSGEAPDDPGGEPPQRGPVTGAHRAPDPNAPARLPPQAPATAPVEQPNSLFLRLASTLTIVLGMAFVIFTLPNTAVRVGPALLGGVVAGLLWQTLQLGSVYVQLWLAGKNAIYSSLAAIPMLMIWIYLSWTILLVGAEVACAQQTEPVVTSLARTGKVDQRLREVLAPRLAVRVTSAFLSGRPAPTAAELASDAGLAPRVVGEVLERLVVAGVLARASDEDDERYLPGRDPDTVRLSEVLAALRREEGGRPPRPAGPTDEAVDHARSALEADAARSPANRTLRELALVEADPHASRSAANPPPAVVPGDLPHPPPA